MPKIITTNCFIHQPPRILLGMKKRGFGVGNWNGFGGKILPGESLRDAAKREMLEECGIVIKSLELFAVINFEFMDSDDKIEMNSFRVLDFEGEPVETVEMKPKWFSADEIPYSKMWPSDKCWMPLFLAGKKFKGDFLLQGTTGVIKYSLTEL